MSIIQEYKDRILAGGEINRAEALHLFDPAIADLDELCAAADELREHFCGDAFDICTIINGKCGKCTEDCKYCAQSAHYPHNDLEAYPLLDTASMLAEAKHNEAGGVLRFSIVTSGKRLSPEEIDQVCETIRTLKRETGLEICVSFGLLDEADFVKLKAAGASRVHCNLESSAAYFPSVCTTHTYEDKIATLKAARRAGLSVCSGGIMGLGESLADRVDLALTARELSVKSLPVNFLNPIPGTPYADNPIIGADEARRTVAVFRFILPDASIRLAGGRGLLPDKGEACFTGGANAAISGDMLTTSGITIAADMQMLQKLGYQPRLWEK
ncbi:MAG TPA: biotin synthase BioB [Candidatus Avidehalobacter gallistercoris]|uniref:Biotin synthase n=1 Tax=Candidatus Avidehalobacter gallistercoris TaxID=2840694 RepID=A0A9D1HMA5_9FIRM|nr:biotin synthase BioB [Candidatus Avidehalobacter gallistercoris]